MTDHRISGMSRRRLLQTMGASGAALALGAGTAAHAQNRGGQLVIGHTTFRHLNPAIQSGQATGVPGANIFAGLVQTDDAFQPQPYLATSWETAADGLSYTFHLDPNARFHDGRPVTSADVAFSLGVVKDNHPFGKVMFGAVSEVQTPDPQTARFVLDRPHPALMAALTPLLMPVLPQHVYGEGDIKTNPANAEPVGSGPFRFADYRPGEFLILERNDDFFREGRPYLDQLLFNVSNNPIANVLGLEQGDIDYLPFAQIRVKDIARLKDNPDLVVTGDGYEALGATNYLEFNLRVPPLDDVRVRKAIAYAIDQDFIEKALLRGEGRRLNGPLTASNPFASDDLVTYDVDLDRARALLDEAGHPEGADGTRMTLTLEWLPDVNINSQEPVAQYIKAQLKKVGIDIELRPNADFGSFATRIGNWDHQLTLNGIWNYPDPLIGVHRAYLSTNIRNAIFSNTEGYNNPRVDEILRKAGLETDFDKRKALYAEFQKIVTDELPLYWTNEEPFYTIYRKGLQNPPLTVWGALAPFDGVSWG